MFIYNSIWPQFCICPVTTVRDFGANSFIEWELTEQFHADLSQSKHKTSLQLMFRTHQNSAHLFKAMNAHKSEYVLLEVSNKLFVFCMPLFTSDKELWPNLILLNEKQG